MPYIKQDFREKLNGPIDELARQIVDMAKQEEYDAAFTGLLNYACTRLALKVARLRFGQIKYWVIAAVTGVFSNVSSEFYRRLAAPYEDKQIQKNGDVDLYEEFLKEIEGR